MAAESLAWTGALGTELARCIAEGRSIAAYATKRVGADGKRIIQHYEPACARCGATFPAWAAFGRHLLADHGQER